MNEMNIQEIIQYLPHRFPFLLIDRVIDLVPDESIVAIKNVTINEPFFQGHFPIKPVMPGVLIIESMAQAGGILAYRSTEWDPESALFYLGAIGEVRFKKMVVPGDQLHIKVEITRRRRTVWKFICQAQVDGETVCETAMTSMQGKAQ